MAATKTYVIRGGVEGRERLRVLARVMWPTTEALLAGSAPHATPGASTSDVAAAT
jgi:hypothetical protein